MSKRFDDDTFLARWLKGDLSEEERTAFEADGDEAQAYQRIANAAGRLKVPPRDKAAAWSKLRQEAGIAPKTAKVRRLNWWGLAAAASVLLLVGYFAFFATGSQQLVRAGLAEKTVHELPDGSEVWLNADSEITYNEKDFQEDRRLELQGEAFFKVEEGSQFTVQTPTGDVRVLGTSFTVQSRNDQLQVACYTGRVGVSFDEFNTSEILDAGNNLRAEQGALQAKGSINAGRTEPSWTTGNSRFENARFSEVVEELERQYNLEINYPPVLDTIRQYNGGFPHRDLETALEVVFSSVAHQYRVNDRNVEVFK